MRCPECGAALDDRAYCANGHAFNNEDGVLRLVPAEFTRMIDPFLTAFAAHRTALGARIMEPSVYPRLPQSGLAIDRAMWRLRVMDLALIEGIIGAQRSLRVLDAGAHNGWLAHRLAANGHRVIATDVFTDPFDGLGAVRHYPVKFDAVQCDQERLDLIEGPFDLIVAQRCMGYVTDIARSIAQMRTLLAPGGTIVLTGLNIFRDPSRIARHFAESATRFATRRGVPYFFKPVKGYLDNDDRSTLRHCGVELRPYPALRWKNAISAPFPWKPLYFYGLLRGPATPER